MQGVPRSWLHIEEPELYTCTTCSALVGAAKLDMISLKNFRDRGRRTLTCRKCVDAKNARIKMLHDKAAFGKPKGSQRYCKCKCFVHQERCPLTPVIYGERRWPGSDGYISADERAFLDSLQPRPQWWLKAWGRPTDDI